MMESDGLNTTFENNPRPRLMPMYGYCIGCVALVTTTHNIDNTELAATAITPSISSFTVENAPSYSGGSALDHAAATSCSETRLFLPTPKKNTTSSSTANNMLHPLNLILLSRSIHNNNNRGFGGEQQQPFLSDICALSLFLLAVAIGIAWGGSGSTNDKKKKKDEQHDNTNEQEYDLVSRRLVYDEFFDVGLVPTIDDDDEEEDVQEQQQQQEKVEKEATNDISVLSPLVGDIIKPQRTLTLTHHEQQEWKKPSLFRPTDDEDETSTTTTEEKVFIEGYRKYLPKPPVIRKSKAKEIVKKSILTIRSPSQTECASAASKVTTKKRVSFHKDVRVKVIPPDDEEASISSSSSSTTKKRKGLFKLHKLSLGNLCESREYVPIKE